MLRQIYKEFDYNLDVCHAISMVKYGPIEKL